MLCQLNSELHNWFLISSLIFASFVEMCVPVQLCLTQLLTLFLHNKLLFWIAASKPLFSSYIHNVSFVAIYLFNYLLTCHHVRQLAIFKNDPMVLKQGTRGHNKLLF